MALLLPCHLRLFSAEQPGWLYSNKVTMCYFSTSLLSMASIPTPSRSQSPLDSLRGLASHPIIFPLAFLTLFSLPQTQQLPPASGTCPCSLVCVESSPVSCITSLLASFLQALAQKPLSCEAFPLSLFNPSTLLRPLLYFFLPLSISLYMCVTYMFMYN